MNSSIKSAALKACRHFMVPVARFLLGIGVGYREFAEISKLAFVQVASDEHGIRGRKTNMSRVAVMTGLNRKEIRKIRDRLDNEDWDLDSSLSKPVSVLAKWYTSPDYLGADGMPIALPLEAKGKGASFNELVRQVGGDVPPGAMLKELQRASCVEEVRPGVWRAINRHYSPSGVDLFQIQRFGECLHDLAETITTNYAQPEGSTARLFEFRAWADAIDPRATPRLKRIVASQGKSYLEAVDDWLLQHGVSDEKQQQGEGIRCGVGIYYFESRNSNVITEPRDSA